MYQPPLVFNPWLLFFALMCVLVGVLLALWRQLIWRWMARMLVVSQGRGNVWIAQHGGPSIVLAIAPAFFVIAIVALLDRWLRLEPNGFVEALDRASQHVVWAALALSLYLVGLALAASSRWLPARSEATPNRSGGGHIRALLAVSGVVLAVAGAAILTVTLSLSGSLA